MFDFDAMGWFLMSLCTMGMFSFVMVDSVSVKETNPDTCLLVFVLFLRLVRTLVSRFSLDFHKGSGGRLVLFSH